MFLPANTTSLIQPCDQGIIRTLKAYYRSEMRNRILTQIDNKKSNDIAKNTSLLDALHLVPKSWDAISDSKIKNCFRKGGFIQNKNENDETFDIESEVDIQNYIPVDMTEEGFDEWMSIDENIETTKKLTEDDICNSLLNNHKEENVIDEEINEEIPEKPPTKIQILEALEILRKGVQHYSTDFKLHYKYEDYIQNMINQYKKQKTIDDYFKN